MGLIEWKDEYSVGVQRIDVQHKRLFEILNEFYDAIMAIKGQEVLQKVVNDLSEYAVIHFKTEEDLMKKYEYPGYAEQKKEHDTFVQKVIDLQKNLQQGGFVLSIDVFNFLKDWLLHHVLKVDKKYASFFNEHGVK